MSDYRVSFNDNVTVGRMPDGRWRAFSATFNVSTYGETEGGAKAKNDDAVNGIVRAMAARGGMVRVRHRFQHAQVAYHIVKADEAMYSESREFDLDGVGAT